LETIFRAVFPGLSRFCADFWSVAYHTNTLTVPLFRRFQPFLATFLPYHVCVLYLADSKSGKKDLPPTFRLSWLLNHRLWHHFAFSFPYSRRTFTSFLCIFVFLYIVFFGNLASSVFATLWALSSSFYDCVVFSTALLPFTLASFCDVFLSVLWRYFRSFGGNNKLAPLVKL